MTRLAAMTVEFSEKLSFWFSIEASGLGTFDAGKLILFMMVLVVTIGTTRLLYFEARCQQRSQQLTSINML
jgi:predicted exporter